MPFMRDPKLKLEKEKLILSKKKDQDDFLDMIMKRKDSKDMETEDFKTLELDEDELLIQKWNREQKQAIMAD
jgi:hypothetical protein